MQYKNKKNLYKIVFITILLGFIISLVGCNWLSFGLLNIFDPQVQIRVDYKLDGVTTEGTANIIFDIFSLNEAEFIGTGFLFEYYNEGIKIPELSRMVGATFYVPPYPLSSFEKPVTIEFPLYFQDVLDYMTLHPLIVEITSTITVIGTDGAGHDISKTITFDLPTILPGIDFTPPNADINVTPGTTGTAPFTVVFDAYGSTDDRGIASYSWDFGDGTSATGVMPAAHTYTNGTYIVKLTVTDYFGNVGVALETITVGEAGAPTAEIIVTPGNTGVAPFTVYFDASQSSVADGGEGCGSCSIVNYDWDFGDGVTGTGLTTSHIYTIPGSYTVILTVTDSNNNQGYDSVTIKVYEAGVPSTITLKADPPTITAGGGTSLITATVKDAGGNPVTDGIVVTFIATSPGILSDITVTTGGIASATLSLTNSGTETISSTVGATSGIASDSITVYCPPVPTP